MARRSGHGLYTIFVDKVFFCLAWGAAVGAVRAGKIYWRFKTLKYLKINNENRKTLTLMVFAPAAAPGGRERTGGRPPHLGAWYPCTGRARLTLESGQKRSVPAANLTFCDVPVNPTRAVATRCVSV